MVLAWGSWLGVPWWDRLGDFPAAGGLCSSHLGDCFLEGGFQAVGVADIGLLVVEVEDIGLLVVGLVDTVLRAVAAEDYTDLLVVAEGAFQAVAAESAEVAVGEDTDRRRVAVGESPMTVSMREKFGWRKLPEPAPETAGSDWLGSTCGKASFFNGSLTPNDEENREENTSMLRSKVELLDPGLLGSTCGLRPRFFMMVQDLH